MKKFQPFKRLNRADIVRAFAAPHLTRQQTLEIVKQYMSDSPVPPAWSQPGVRGVFGKGVARMWARHLRHRPTGCYRDSQSGRWLHPAIQTAFDLGTSPEAMKMAGVLGHLEAAVKLQNQPVLPVGMLIMIDEYHNR
jgi:hypothetical protein